MKNEIVTLIEAIKTDYAEWMRSCAGASGRDVNLDMIERFNNGIEVKEGRKYIKILTERTVWGFVVNGEDKKFAKGDILKAAGYNAPARNAARGNIIEGGYSINWTGPNYL